MDPLKLSGDSADITEEQKNKLQELFPEVFSEGKINWQKLKATLGEVVELGEQYSLTWKGKSDVFRIIQEPTTKTLKPMRNESANFDDTGNIFIEGDNLDALKVLQKAYYGKVKMIYIDPPYNTGSDFVYNDKFAEKRASYEQEVGLRDENGMAARADGLRKNSRDNGHYHSDWLNMMYPRLYLARNLLRLDGVIFISIDDNEVHNLRQILNDIFGEENFIGEIIWQKKYTQSNDAKNLSVTHEYILMYARSADEFKVGLLERTEKQLSVYKNPDNDSRGNWKPTPLTVRTPSDEYVYEIELPSGRKVLPPRGRSWMYSQKSLNQDIADNRIWFGVTGDSTPSKKSFLSEVKAGVIPKTLWTYDEVGHNHEAINEFRALDLDGTFDSPKPTRLIERMIKIAQVKSDDLVLDFFAGSGTTAHAVMKSNAADGQMRRWVCIQIPEETAEKSEARKAGFVNIAELSRERIRRAAKEIAKQNHRSDTGFKSLRLEDTNFKVWDSSAKGDQLKQQMIDHLNPVKDGVNEEDLLFELALKSGISPTSSRNQFENADGKYYIVDDSLAICLESSMSASLFENILSARPNKIIILDSSLHNNDELKTNLLLRAKKTNIEILVI